VTFFASDIGETIKCRSCEEPLRVAADGLQRAGGGGAKAPPLPAAAEPRTVREATPAARPAAAPAGHSAPRLSVFETFSWLLGWFFLPGLVLVLAALLLPLVHNANVESIKADERAGKLRLEKAHLALERKVDQKREDWRKSQRELEVRKSKLAARQREADRQTAAGSKSAELPNELKAIAEERKAVEDAERKLAEDDYNLTTKLHDEFKADEDKLAKDEHEWNLTYRELQQNEAEAANFTSKMNLFYSLGMVLGLVMLSAGSVGYLSAKQSVARRVVGAVTLGLIVLLVLSGMPAVTGVLRMLTGR
jgi:lipopolysaccharide export LptBFGC system permease protein LptF